MNKLTFQTNYEVVENESMAAYYHHDKHGKVFKGFIRPVPDSIILSREQYNELVKRIAGDAWEAGWDIGDGNHRDDNVEDYKKLPDFDTYINSIIK